MANEQNLKPVSSKKEAVPTMQKSTDGSNTRVTTIPPCKGCERRHTACHDECDQYREWKQRLEIINKERSEYNRSLRKILKRLLTV